MILGQRIFDLRKQKNFSQGEIEKRSGLLRCYISRVENGHTIPSVETLERLARALEIPVYRFFCDDSQSVRPPKQHFSPNTVWPTPGNESNYFVKLRKALARMAPKDRQLVMYLAQKVSRGDSRSSPKPAINKQPFANSSKRSSFSAGKPSGNRKQNPSYKELVGDG